MLHAKLIPQKADAREPAAKPSAGPGTRTQRPRACTSPASRPRAPPAPPTPRADLALLLFPPREHQVSPLFVLNLRDTEARGEGGRFGGLHPALRRPIARDRGLLRLFSGGLPLQASLAATNTFLAGLRHVVGSCTETEVLSVFDPGSYGLTSGAAKFGN